MPRITPQKTNEKIEIDLDFTARQKKEQEEISHFVSKLFKKPTQTLTDDEKITSYLGEEMSGAELVIWASSPKFTKETDEKGHSQNLEYFVHLDDDNPYVTAVSMGGASLDEEIEEMCNIARLEQLPVYGLHNGVPLYTTPSSMPKKVQKTFENVNNAFRKTYTSASHELKEVLGEHSRGINVSDYLKSKEFVKKNPDFPLHPALLAYGKYEIDHLSRNDNNVAVFSRQLGRNPKITEALLRCMEPGEYLSQPLVFNEDKVKSLANGYIDSRTKQPPVRINAGREHR